MTYAATAEIASLHPGRTAVISLGDQVLGFLGQVHPVTAKAYDIPETYVAELNLSAIEVASSTSRSICGNHQIPSSQP